MAGAAGFFVRGNLRGALRHIHGRPEFELVAVRIGEINYRPVLAVGGGTDWIGVRNSMAIEPAQVSVDVLWSDVETAARQILPQFFCLRINLRLKESADAARTAFP